MKMLHEPKISMFAPMGLESIIKIVLFGCWFSVFRKLDLTIWSETLNHDKDIAVLKFKLKAWEKPIYDLNH
jgi:hypothetical protein